MRDDIDALRFEVQRFKILYEVAVNSRDACRRWAALWGRVAREYRGAARLATKAARTEAERRRAAEARVRELEGAVRAYQQASEYAYALQRTQFPDDAQAAALARVTERYDALVALVEADDAT